MRIAILADIHGNLAAFEAALEHASRQHPDQIVIAGDVIVGAPDSAACWQLAVSLGCPILRGNHERYVAHFDCPDAPAIWKTDQFGPVRWAYQQLPAAARAALADLPLHVRPAGCPGLLIVHSSLRNDRDMLVAYTPDHEIATMFPDLAESTVVRGHNHIPGVRLWQGRKIITTGAVGLALDLEPSAQYLMLDQTSDGWDIRHQSAPYDRDATIRRFRESGYLEAAGPMARLLLREVATATGHMVPFLRAYERWSVTETIPLDQAVDRFFTYL